MNKEVSVKFNKSIVKGQWLSVNRGFTLVELIVVMFGFAILSFGLVALVSNVFMSSTQQANLLADSDAARSLSNKLINELRNASLSSVGAYPLDTADAQTIIFYSNVDNDADIERVRYFVQNGKLLKGIINPTGNPLTYNSNNEKILTVQANLANGTSPLFYYYNGTYTGKESALTQPVNVTEVKTVKLDLRIFNKAGVTNSSYYTVVTHGVIRSLKTNLGE
jgi:type II secretory pathway pseudopilin PulG